MRHLWAVTDTHDSKLDAVGAEGFNMSIVHKTDSPHVDNHQIRSCLFQRSNV